MQEKIKRKNEKSKEEYRKWKKEQEQVNTVDPLHKIFWIRVLIQSMRIPHHWVNICIFSDSSCSFFGNAAYNKIVCQMGYHQLVLRSRLLMYQLQGPWGRWWVNGYLGRKYEKIAS